MSSSAYNTKINNYIESQTRAECRIKIKTLYVILRITIKIGLLHTRAYGRFTGQPTTDDLVACRVCHLCGGTQVTWCRVRHWCGGTQVTWCRVPLVRWDTGDLVSCATGAVGHR